MKIDGRSWRTIWPEDDGRAVGIIDQTALPHEFRTLRLENAAAVAGAIRSMRVRGAPLIGAAGAWGVALAMRDDATDSGLATALESLRATRPTGRDLYWALEDMRSTLEPLAPGDRFAAARERAAAICDDDVAACEAIGRHGVGLIREAREAREATGGGRPVAPGAPVNILTHCNAGWLATVDWGTALAPVYRAHDDGIPVHVWVGETRPRNQGAALTAWELGRHGVPHTVIVDNAGGHLMQHGQVDLCITGSDRTTATGDVCNKIGTYLKALAARDNGIPFYVALPHSTIDWSLTDGVGEIPIEEREAGEVSGITGRGEDGAARHVALIPDGTAVANPAFDVTPRALVTALVTERGVCAASREGLHSLYPERA